MRIKSRLKGQMMTNIGGGRGAQMLPPAPPQEAAGVEQAERPDAQTQAAARERALRGASAAQVERVPSRDERQRLRDDEETSELKKAADRAGLGGGGMDLEQLLALVKAMSARAGASGACGGGGGCNGGGGGGGCDGGGGGGGTETNNSNETFDATDATNTTDGANTSDATGTTSTTNTSGADSDAAAADFLKLRQASADAAEQAVPKDDPLRKMPDAALERQAPTTAVANELTRRAARAALEAGTARVDVVKGLHKKAESGAPLTRDERRDVMIAGERAATLQQDADRRAHLAKAARDAAARIEGKRATTGAREHA